MRSGTAVRPGPAAVLAVLLIGGCTAGDPPRTPRPAVLAWQEITLPAPVDGNPRVVLRDAATCADRWYVVGGTVAADGGTRPAAWRSGDGRSWQSMPFTALPTSLYGPQNIIYSVACRDGEVAMLGARSGGVHGNPRVSTWRLAGDTMAEVDAPFDLYGGPDAVNVAHLAAGPAGFAIAGNRATGAAVWLSGDAAKFRLVSGVPGLDGTAELTPTASDVAVSGAGVMLIGSVRRAGRVDSDPAAWQSTDGRDWARTDFPGGTDDELLQRVVRRGDDLVAVGLRGSTFGAWQLPAAAASGTPWRAAGRFGRTAPGGIAEVRAVAVAGNRLIAAVDDGAGYGLWWCTEFGSWTAAALPAAQASGPGRGMAIAGSGDRLLLAADDGVRARVWRATVS